MRYIHLNNDSYILYTSKGMVTLTTKSFNFHKIKNFLDKNVEEEEILPLLETPELPDGVFEAYLSKDNQMLYKHFSNDPKKQVRVLKLNDFGADSIEDLTFIGVYASKKDLMDDWPEYLL